MRAVVVESFGVEPEVREVPEPRCPDDGVTVRVAATGLCRSDWHGWMGHDPDIVLPHVPGHEFAGEIVEVGRDVTRSAVGQRVTAPFVCACGRCATCLRGDAQICERQQQPGFTYAGSFAEYVAVPVADVNVVPLPDEIDVETAASLGCRFATAHRAVIAQGRVGPGDPVVVVGCGGVGLSAVMIAVAQGASVVAVDPSAVARERALELGASGAVDPSGQPGVDGAATAVRELTGGGARVSIDAIGGTEPLLLSLAALRPRGRHVQVGLMGAAASVPVSVISMAVARELEIVGSHGMAAADYPAMLAGVTDGRYDIDGLVRRRVDLETGAALLARLGDATVDGVTLLVP